LIFTGIDFLQAGMAGVSWDLEALAGKGVGAMWILAGIGVVMTVVMQSSSAAAATTLVALDAGSLTFEQGCAMIVGQSVGTAATTGLVMVGGSLAVRRSSLAHIIFSVIVGVLSILFLGPLTAAADWVGAQLYDPDGVLAMATFSSLFKLAGIVVFYPWLDHFASFIIRISGTGRESAVSRLDPTLAEAGGEVALEAAWRAILEVAHDAVAVIRRRLAGESVTYNTPAEGTEQIDHFLESLPLESTDLATIGPRLVRLCHASDHLSQLHDDLTRIPPVATAWQPPAGFEAGAQALGGWLDATENPQVAADPAIFKALEAASKQLNEERKTGREKILQDIALQRTPTAIARAALETLVWADLALYHSWRLAESLRIASGK
jgi:phosphate:Na+ symporter